MRSRADKKGSVIASFVLCAFILFLLIRDSDTALGEMKRGLGICGNVLIPTLFPYMVISELLVRSEFGTYAGRLFGKPMKKLFGVSGACAGALILGLLCGFPVGAKTAAALYEKGDISKSECEALMTFCNFPSAPFMIFAVGQNLFESKIIGIFLYLTVILNGLLYGMIRHYFIRTCSPDRKKLPSCGSKVSFIKIFTDSVASAAGSVIIVCAYVTFFTCTVGSFAALLGSDSHSLFKATLFSFFELTSGSAACAGLESVRMGVILTAAAAGWSGLSVFLQIYSLSRTEREEISLRPYILSKAISSVGCAVITAAALYFFPTAIPEKSPSADTFAPAISFPSDFISAVNIFFILSLLFYLCKKLDRRRTI